MGNKTKPIGVRFDENLLNDLKQGGLASSPQKALNLYEEAYVKLLEIRSDRLVEVGVQKEETSPKGENVHDKIAAIRAEVIPPHQNTFLGRKLWTIEQDKKN